MDKIFEQKHNPDQPIPKTVTEARTTRLRNLIWLINLGSLLSTTVALTADPCLWFFSHPLKTLGRNKYTYSLRLYGSITVKVVQILYQLLNTENKKVYNTEGLSLAHNYECIAPDS